MLIDADSIAIWDRNKIVVILAITALGVTIAFHLNSKSLPCTLLQKTWNPIQTWFCNRYRKGEWPISNSFDQLGLSHSVASLCMGPYTTRLRVCQD